MHFRENNNGRSKQAYTVTDIPHLQQNNRICKNVHISTITVPMATKLGRVVNFHEGVPIYKVARPFDYMVLWNHVTNYNHYITTITVPIATKLARMMPYLDGLQAITSHDPLITWYLEITSQSKIIISPLTTVCIATKLSGRLTTYLKRLLPMQSHGSWVTWSGEITWQIKNILPPLTQCLWPPVF